MTLQGGRTVGTQALVTGDGGRGAVTAPALALVYTTPYSTVHLYTGTGMSPVTSWLMEM